MKVKSEETNTIYCKEKRISIFGKSMFKMLFICLMIIFLGIFMVGCSQSTESRMGQNSSESMFRGNLQRTGVFMTKGVHELTELKWQLQTDDKVNSSPAVSDGVVYFGSDDNYLYAVNTQTGQLNWKFPTINFKFLSSPAVRVVYFGSTDNYLYAVDVNTGQLKWKFKTDGEVFSSPAVSDGVVYFGSGDYLYAIN